MCFFLTLSKLDAMFLLKRFKRLPLLLLMVGSLTSAQTLPEGFDTVPFTCPPRERVQEPQNEAERLQAERRARYRTVLPAYLAAVPAEPDAVLMPVEGVRVANVADTWGAARDGGRFHEGQDIFAPTGTPVYAATPGYLYRVGESIRGGNTVVVVGGGGRRYYYAHLSDYGENLIEGQFVTPDTVLGYVGTSGNAVATPPHLHFGIYTGEAGTCEWDAIDPLPLLVDRE